MKQFKVDSHLHIYTSWIDPKYEQGPRDLITLTREFIKRGLNAGTITSFNDNRFDRLIDNSDLPYDWDIKNEDKGVIITTDFGKKFYWFNSDEKPTKQGHILLIGNKRQTKHIKPYQNLEETLGQAEQEVSFIVADHPLMVMKDVRSSGIGLENLEKYQEYFTAGELNGNCRTIPGIIPKGLNKKTAEVCRELNLPIIANSDAYGQGLFLSSRFNLNNPLFCNIGKTYTEYDEDDLDLTSIDNLLKSIKQTIKQDKQKPVLRNNSGNTYLSILEHIGFSVFYGKCKDIKFLGINHHGGRVVE